MSVLLPEHQERSIGAGEDYLRTPGGVFVPSWAEVELTATAPIGIDFFAGAGGFSCGFHAAGWHVIAASEWWPVAVLTYVCNLGSPDTLIYVGESPAPDSTKRDQRALAPFAGSFITAQEFFDALGADLAPGDGWIKSETGPAALACEVVFCCDVRELTGDFILDTLDLDGGDVGCVFGGPPCQGFSRAGRQQVTDPRNTLVFEFARLVCEIKPQAMCMENVPGIVDMVTPEGVPVIDALTMILERGGMGEYEALRRSLMSTAGLGAVVKGAKKPGRKRTTDVDDVEHDEIEEGEPQLALDLADRADVPEAVSPIERAESSDAC